MLPQAVAALHADYMRRLRKAREACRLVSTAPRNLVNEVLRIAYEERVPTWSDAFTANAGWPLF